MDAPSCTRLRRSRAVHLAAALLALLALTVARDARAVVRQPDGTTVPVAGMRPLQGYFDMRGEAINAVNDAAVEPQRFVPGCTIRFTVIVRDTGYMDSFGWYNVVPGRAPDASGLYELVSDSAPVGFTATLDVGTDPRYRGGEIGFYLRTTPGYVYYSERAYQPDREMTGGFVHVLLYDSRVTRNAFYFAWEDLFGGGDNDFQDLLVLVDNLVCAGGGAPCDTGERGACAQGIRQCRSGMLTCLRVQGPSPERCDGVDNDCNGTTDDGMGLCPPGQVCERGACVPQCVEGSCFAGQTCTPRGTCVETACLAVTCPEGQRCVAGRCAGQCDGVTCPHGLVCRAGRCVDPCAGLACDAMQVCVAGVCQPRCPCRRCAMTETCGADGRCVEASCAAMTCPAGTHCAGGRCVDSCQGAACPVGQVCRAGRCEDAPAAPDGGLADGGGAGDGGAFGDGGRADGGGGGDARGDARGDAGRGRVEGGCGCRAAGRAGGSRERAPGVALAAGLAAGLAAFARRRRSR